MFFRDSLFRSGFTYPHLHRSTSNRRWHTEQQYVAELNEDVQAFVELLESLGIIVHRPISLPFDGSSTSDLGWEALQE